MLVTNVQAVEGRRRKIDDGVGGLKIGSYSGGPSG